MSARIRFIVVLALALTALSAATWYLVMQTTRGWFERDLALRADLAVSGARRALVEDLEAGDRRGLRNLLTDIARDERILAAAVRNAKFEAMAETLKYPPSLSCAELGPKVVAEDGSAWRTWRQPGELQPFACSVVAMSVMIASMPRTGLLKRSAAVAGPPGQRPG